MAQTYAQTAEPRLNQAAAISNVGFSWAGLRFLLMDGQLALGAPADGRVSTAVFVGHGALEVAPPNVRERQQMERFLGRGGIAGGFTQVVFRFADPQAFYAALGSGVHFAPRSSGGDAEHILHDRAQAIEKRGSPEIARLLQALDTPAPSHLLLAQIKLLDGAWLDAQFDPSQPDPLCVFAWTPIPDSDLDYANVWTQFTPAGMPAPPPPIRPDHYVLTVRLDSHFQLEADASFTLAAAGGLAAPGVLLGLNPALRVTNVASDGRPLPWFQAPKADWLYLRLPPLPAASSAPTLAVSYRGHAPFQPGSGANGGAALSGWYPTLPLDPPWARPAPPAEFDLHFSIPTRYQLVASGVRAADSVAGGIETSEWKSPQPLPAAGFEVGELTMAQKQLTLADGHTLQLTIGVPRQRDPAALLPLAGSKLADIFNFMGSSFGPYPYAAASLTISGLEPYLPLADPRPMLVAFDPRSFIDASPDLTGLSPAVSAAGQWWGAWTIPAAPSDDWLVQGLRSASGLLYQWDRDGPAFALETLREWRQFLLRPDPDSHHVPEFTGALVLGAQRLGSDDDAGVPLLQVKGGYIIFMLHQMMLDSRRPGQPSPFLAMMRDFTATYGGRAVTTAEFQAVVEKHMTAAMDLDHNRKMDWFFGPLLEGTAVPQLSFRAETAPPVKGVAQVQLTVENPQHWKGLLPVYLFRDANTWVSGLIPITQDHVVNTIPVPFNPQYIEANHFQDMLIEVRQ